MFTIFYGIRTHCLGTNLNPVLNYRSSHIQTDESAKSFQILGGWPRHRGLSLPCQAETFVRLLFGFLLKVRMYTYLHLTGLLIKSRKQFCSSRRCLAMGSLFFIFFTYTVLCIALCTHYQLAVLHYTVLHVT